jgi:phenylalanyl-tRNA synthetase beta chain
MQNILKSLAFTEVYSYSFLSEETKNIFAINNAPEIANPVSSEAKYLRTSLIPNLAVAAKNNLRFYNTLRLFETGNVFSKQDNGVTEREQIAGLIISKGAFPELKGLVISFLTQLGIDDFEFNDSVSDTYEGKHWYHPGQVATIRAEGEIVGIMGNLNPQISHQMDLKKGATMAMFSFNLQKLINAMETELEFEPIPKYPSVIRDISLLVDTETMIGQILNTINENDKSGIVQDVDVFDIYEPNAEEEAEGTSRKSVAFHLIFRSNDRTLTVEEVDEAENQIKTALKDTLGAEVR